ncbi:MAG TPA: hypothetical protein VE914_11580 [Candidatus Angelobacter sp.]|nr:hypothetical protein [Candidatus Angelobacter sp.]
MWRYASLSILAVAVLTGCQLFKPTLPPAPPPAQTTVVPEPPATPPPPPEPAPLPAQKPAQVAAMAPVAAPPPGPDPKELVGLDFAQTQHLLGKPSKQDEKPPAKVWTYNGTECDLTIFFYADINTRQFRALTYEIKNHQATEGTDDQCLAHLIQGT